MKPILSTLKLPKFIMEFVNVMDLLSNTGQSNDQNFERFKNFYNNNPQKKAFISNFIQLTRKFREERIIEQARNYVLHYKISSPSTDFLSTDDLKEMKKRGAKQEYLNKAALKGALKCFKFLIDNNCKPDNNTLKNAIYGGNMDILKSLQQFNLTIDTKALFYAFESQRSDVSDWILQQITPDCNEEMSKYIKTFNIRSIFYRIINKKADFYIDDLLYYFADKEFIDYLLEQGGEVHNPSYCLIQSILANNIEHTKFFLEEKFADANFVCETSSGKINAIKAAILTNDEELISYVFSNFCKFDTKQTISFNTIENYNLLVSKGFDKNNLIKFTCKDGNFNLFEEITQDMTTFPDEFVNLACQSYHSKILEYVLTKNKSPLKQELFNDVFFQHLSYTMKLNTRINLLLDGTKKTVKEVVEAEVIKVIGVLLQNGLDVNKSMVQSQDIYEYPLTMALRGGYGQVVEYLIKNGANINITSNREINDELIDVKPLFYAIEYNDLMTVKSLLMKGASWQGTVRTPDGIHSALSLACRCGKVDTAKFLLDFGFSDPCSYLHINTNDKEKAQRILILLALKRVPKCKEVDVIKLATDLDLKNMLYDSLSGLEEVPIEQIYIPPDPTPQEVLAKSKDLTTKKNPNEQGKSSCCLLI